MITLAASPGTPYAFSSWTPGGALLGLVIVLIVVAGLRGKK